MSCVSKAHSRRSSRNSLRQSSEESLFSFSYCDLCSSSSFENESDYISHLVYSHFQNEISSYLLEDEINKCPKCQLSGFSNKDSLVFHLGKDHSLAKILLSEKINETRKFVKRKSETLSKDSSFKNSVKCQICGLLFANQKKYNSHVEKEHINTSKDSQESKSEFSIQGEDEDLDSEEEEEETLMTMKDNNFAEFSRQVRENLKTLDGQHAIAVDDRNIQCICGKIVRLCTSYYWRYLIQKPLWRNGRLEQKGHWFNCDLVKRGVSFIPDPMKKSQDLPLKTKEEFPIRRKRQSEAKWKYESEEEDEDEDEEEDDEEDEDESENSESEAEDLQEEEEEENDEEFQKEVTQLLSSRSVNTTFLQDGPCFQVASQLTMCHMCSSMSPFQRKGLLLKGNLLDETSEINCCFYSFRKLKCVRSGVLVVDGYLDPNLDPNDEQLSLWTPNFLSPPSFSKEHAKFILGLIGDQFCDMVAQETRVSIQYSSLKQVIAWKPAVRGVREMCDVCKTTLFNYHWICSSCGLFVCLDCHQFRQEGLMALPSFETDEYNWPLCHRNLEHSIDSLMMAQIIPKNALVNLATTMHVLRDQLAIPQYCHKDNSAQFKSLYQNLSSTSFSHGSTAANNRVTYQCPLCSNGSFKWPSSLYKHCIFKHFEKEIWKELPSEPPFKCPLCTHTVANKTMLGIHYGITHKIIQQLIENVETIHSCSSDIINGDKPEKCALCSLHVSSSNILNHLVSHYKDRLSSDLPSRPPFRCPKCRFVGLSHSHLLQHYGGLGHGVVVALLGTDGLFMSSLPNISNTSSLDVPIPTEGVECIFCDSLPIFRHSVDFYRHLSEIHFKDRLLSSLDSLKQEKDVNKAFNCSHCNLSCPTKSNYLIHVGVVHRVSVSYYYDALGLQAPPPPPSSSSGENPPHRTSCGICGASVSSLVLHLAESHFKEQVKHLSVSSPFQCPICPHMAPNYENLIRHYGVFHKIFENKIVNVKKDIDKSSVCVLCDELPSFSSPIDFGAHLMSSHFKDKVLPQFNSISKCSECNYNSKGKVDLSSHMCLKHGFVWSLYKDITGVSLPGKEKDKSLLQNCSLCPFNTYTPHLYLSHLITVHFKEDLLHMMPKSKPYLCPWPNCSVSMEDRSNLAEHYGLIHKVVLSLERVKCNFCPKIFNNKVDKVKHVVLHLRKILYKDLPSISPFTCSMCSNFKASNRITLLMHIGLTHTQVIESLCAQDPKSLDLDMSFMENVSSKKEVLKVSSDKGEEKRFPKCRSCNYRYFNRLDLCRHFVDYHLRIKLEGLLPNEADTCPRCSMKYSNHQSLVRHLIWSHEDLESLVIREIGVKLSEFTPSVRDLEIMKKKEGHPLHKDVFELTDLAALPVYTDIDVKCVVPSCELCGEAFTSSSNKIRDKSTHLLSHFRDDINSLLPSKAPFKCPDCSFEGKDQFNLFKHYGLLHKTVFSLLQKELGPNWNLPPSPPSSSSSSRLFTCSFCQQSLHTARSLTDHYSNTHYVNQLSKHVESSGDVYICRFCKFNSKNLSTLLRHVGYKHEIVNELLSKDGFERKLSCSLCPEEFISQNDLYIHGANVHFMSRLMKDCPLTDYFSCPSCSLTSKDYESLLYHYGLFHNAIQRYFDETSKSISSSSSSSLSNSCPICTTEHESPLALLLHCTEIHFSERLIEGNEIRENTYKCPECQDSFKGSLFFTHHYGISHRIVEKLLKIEYGMTVDVESSYSRSIEEEEKREMESQSEKISLKSSIGEERTNSSLKKDDEYDENTLVAYKSNSCSSPPIGIQCVLCYQVFETKVEFMSHLINRHFKSELLQDLPRSSPYICPQCSFEDSNIESLLTHYGMSHRVLESLLGGVIPGTFVSIKSSNKVANSQKCPFCELVFDNVTHFCQHLCDEHFREQIAARLPLSPPFICPLNDCTFDSQDNHRSLIVHYGIVHKYVLELLKRQTLIHQKVSDSKLTSETSGKSTTTTLSELSSSRAKCPSSILIHQNSTVSQLSEEQQNLSPSVSQFTTGESNSQSHCIITQQPSSSSSSMTQFQKNSNGEESLEEKHSQQNPLTQQSSQLLQSTFLQQSTAQQGPHQIVLQQQGSQLLQPSQIVIHQHSSNSHQSVLPNQGHLVHQQQQQLLLLQQQQQQSSHIVTSRGDQVAQQQQQQQQLFHQTQQQHQQQLLLFQQQQNQSQLPRVLQSSGTCEEQQQILLQGQSSVGQQSQIIIQVPQNSSSSQCNIQHHHPQHQQHHSQQHQQQQQTHLTHLLESQSGQQILITTTQQSPLLSSESESLVLQSSLGPVVISSSQENYRESLEANYSFVQEQEEELQQQQQLHHIHIHPQQQQQQSLPSISEFFGKVSIYSSKTLELEPLLNESYSYDESKSESSLLKNEEEKSSGVKVCELCGKRFEGKNKSMLKVQHLAHHFKERLYVDLKESSPPFHCPINDCSYQTRNKPDWARHYGSVHKLIEQYLREELKKNSEKTLNEVSVLNKNIGSSSCNSNSSSSSCNSNSSQNKLPQTDLSQIISTALSQHNLGEQMSYRCFICEGILTFKTENDLNDHINRHHINVSSSQQLELLTVQDVRELFHKNPSSSASSSLPSASSRPLPLRQPKSTSSKSTNSGRRCELCGFEPKTKNKPRERQDHLAMKHYKERIVSDLSKMKELHCPLCTYVGKDKQTIYRHYTGKHKVVEAYLEEDLNRTSTQSSVSNYLEAASVPQVDGAHDETSFKSSLYSDCPLCGQIMKPNKHYHYAYKHFKDKLSSIIPSARPYLCPECNYEAKQRINLWTHYLSRHGYSDLWVTDLLKKESKGLEKRNTSIFISEVPMSLSDFWCDLCQKTYKNLSKIQHFVSLHFKEKLLDILSLQESEPPFICSYCQHESRHFINLCTHYIQSHESLEHWISEALEIKTLSLESSYSKPSILLDPRDKEQSVNWDISDDDINSSTEEENEEEEEKNEFIMSKELLQGNGISTALNQVHQLNPSLFEPLKISKRKTGNRSRLFKKMLKSSNNGNQLLNFCNSRNSDPRIRLWSESHLRHPTVEHSWLSDGHLLILENPANPNNINLFQEQWIRGQPIIVKNCNQLFDMTTWVPQAFRDEFGDTCHDIVNTKTGRIISQVPLKHFWDGFENLKCRMRDIYGNPMLLKLKDWPTDNDIANSLPSKFADFMKAIPLKEYTLRTGTFNLASSMPDFFVRPDLGPKMYIAYGNALYKGTGTTNLHIDMSDACNVLVYVGLPKDGKYEEHYEEGLRQVDEAGCDLLTRRRVRESGQKIGAIWHIYHPKDADKIRNLINKVSLEKGIKIETNTDPIHDQRMYLDSELRLRLYREYGVTGYAYPQCDGDTVFIPAGAPHQVRNIHNCIKIAEDFVSPENLEWCFFLTEEFRHLSDTHTNHEDKLQIKNILYHAVKDCVAVLENVVK